MNSGPRYPASAEADPALSEIREVIAQEVARAGYRLDALYLFGSRARGEQRPDSDWDFYVAVDRLLSFAERSRIASRIRWRLAHMDLTADVFVQSAEEMRRHRDDTGRLAYYVLRSGRRI